MASDTKPSREELEERVKLAFGRVLRESRLNQKGGKMAQEHLAYEAGYDRTYIFKLENGTYQPTLTAFIMLAYHLEISPITMLKSVLKEIEQSGND